MSLLGLPALPGSAKCRADGPHCCEPLVKRGAADPSCRYLSNLLPKDRAQKSHQAYDPGNQHCRPQAEYRLQNKHCHDAARKQEPLFISHPSRLHRLQAMLGRSRTPPVGAGWDGRHLRGRVSLAMPAVGASVWASVPSKIDALSSRTPGKEYGHRFFLVFWSTAECWRVSRNRSGGIPTLRRLTGPWSVRRHKPCRRS